MNRKLDVKIAKAKGLDVVGEMYACKLNTGLWALYFSDDRFDLHPVYVDQCVCAFQDEYDVKYKGHILGCLDVVPFWSSDLNTAWQLVDEMIESDMKIEEVFVKKAKHNAGCLIDYLGEFSGFYTGLDYIGASADTPQEAICKAYLEWHLTRNQN